MHQPMRRLPAGTPAMQRHAGPRRGARAAGMTLFVCPQRAHASRASHAPRMGPHGPSSAYPLAWATWHAPPCSGMRAPCEASGRLGRALPLARSGPAPAAPRMGSTWARMGRAAPTLLRGRHGMRPHAVTCGPPARRLGGRAAPFRWPVAGPRQPRAACAAHGPAWADVRGAAPNWLLPRVSSRSRVCGVSPDV
jgi:hypothetical protein